MPTIRLPVLWVLIALVHGAAAAYAWQMLPHGFSADHPRFWVNQVLPFAIVALGVVCVIGLWRRVRLAAFAIAVFAGLHAGMAVAWIAVFPITGSRPAIATAVIALVLCGCAVASVRGTRWLLASGAAVGLVVGAAVPWAQRGADAATHPSEAVRALAPATPSELPPWVRASSRAVSIDAGELRIELHPLLTFISRSPDRGWTLLASDADRMGRGADEPAALRVSAADDTVHVAAETVVRAEVYSHLNYFCAMEISGHRRLFVAFSAMPAQRIEVMYSEYPVGRPARFAYVDAARVLHVVEAESGEKGPFTELARGPLPANAPLGITLFDEQQPIAELVLADFAAQASTQLSPTAGWGVPENAIEFSLRADRADAPAQLYITLAGTSVGRGFDSVGHAPGLYRNRMQIRGLP